MLYIPLLSTNYRGMYERVSAGTVSKGGGGGGGGILCKR